MDFSSSGRQLAVGFEGGSVGLLASLPFKGGQSRWDVVGSLKPHPNCNSLAGVAFGEAPSGATKLFSLGATMPITAVCTLRESNVNLRWYKRLWTDLFQGTASACT